MELIAKNYFVYTTCSNKKNVPTFVLENYPISVSISCYMYIKMNQKYYFNLYVKNILNINVIISFTIKIYRMSQQKLWNVRMTKPCTTTILTVYSYNFPPDHPVLIRWWYFFQTVWGLSAWPTQVSVKTCAPIWPLTQCLSQNATHLIFFSNCHSLRFQFTTGSFFQLVIVFS